MGQDQTTAVQPLSKTRRKQQAKQVEELARRLVELPQHKINEAGLAPVLCEEIALARETCGRGSHKRQLKHLAGLLRQQPQQLARIEELLRERDQVQRSDRQQFHLLESLRDQLCDPQQCSEGLQQLQQLFPSMDIKGIQRLATSVHNSRDKKAYREIFRRLRQAAETSGTTG